MPPGSRPREVTGNWVSAGDLADWVYCPRAHYFRSHPPPEGEDPQGRALRDAGTGYHDRFLRSELRRERAGANWWIAAAAGVVLLLVAFALLGPL